METKDIVFSWVLSAVVVVFLALTVFDGWWQGLAPGTRTVTFDEVLQHHRDADAREAAEWADLQSGLTVAYADPTAAYPDDAPPMFPWRAHYHPPLEARSLAAVIDEHGAAYWQDRGLRLPWYNGCEADPTMLCFSEELVTFSSLSDTDTLIINDVQHEPRGF